MVLLTKSHKETLLFYNLVKYTFIAISLTIEEEIKKKCQLFYPG